MHVFDYVAKTIGSEDQIQTGTLVARDKLDAYDKLRRHGLELVRIKRIEGISAVFRKMAANIR